MSTEYLKPFVINMVYLRYTNTWYANGYYLGTPLNVKLNMKNVGHHSRNRNKIKEGAVLWYGDAMRLLPFSTMSIIIEHQSCIIIGCDGDRFDFFLDVLAKETIIVGPIIKYACLEIMSMVRSSTRASKSCSFVKCNWDLFLLLETRQKGQGCMAEFSSSPNMAVINLRSPPSQNLLFMWYPLIWRPSRWVYSRTFGTCDMDVFISNKQSSPR